MAQSLKMDQSVVLRGIHGLIQNWDDIEKYANGTKDPLKFKEGSLPLVKMSLML
jgi:hypothetical protein